MPLVLRSSRPTAGPCRRYINGHTEQSTKHSLKHHSARHWCTLGYSIQRTSCICLIYRALATRALFLRPLHLRVPRIAPDMHSHHCKAHAFSTARPAALPAPLVSERQSAPRSPFQSSSLGAMTQTQSGAWCGFVPQQCQRHAVVTRSAGATQGGSLGGEAAGETMGAAGRGFKRRTKALLKKKSGEPTHAAGADAAPAAGPVAAAAATAVLTAPVETSYETANNILPSGTLTNNNLSRHRALVLDCAYRPINVITWAKAVMMDWSEKAEVVEYYPPPAKAVSGQGLHMLPAVIRVTNRYLDVNEVVGQVSCTRRNVLVRDKFTCQYCGGTGRDSMLTVDHIIPASKGGRNTWLNLVTACMTCNQRKGDKMLAQLGWKLRSTPKKPTPWELGLVVGLCQGDVERPCAEWAPYLEPYRQKIADIRRRAHEAGMESSSEAEN